MRHGCHELKWLLCLSTHVVFVRRAVGGYLQGAFENLNADTRRGEKDGVSTIGLDHTLRGKSRKEAARMFFETLVITY